MKQFLKFSGVIAFLLTVVGFILFMATPAITYKGDTAFKGTEVIFGSKILFAEVKPSVLALIAWIFVLIAMLLLLCLVVLTFVKKDLLDKFGRIGSIIVALLLILAAIFSFFTVPTFYSANGGSAPDGISLGVGWIIGAILLILAGGLTICPLILKKK